MIRKYLLLILATFLTFPFLPLNTLAAVEDCTASVSPTSLRPDSTYNLEFTVGNADEEINWVKITRRVDDFTLFSTFDQGWDISGDVDSFIYENGTISPNGSHVFTIVVQTGPNEIPSQEWIVEVANDSVGLQTVGCSGDLLTEISSSAPESNVDYPQILALTVSNLTENSAKVSWNTDKNTSSVVEYGLTTGYGSNLNNSTRKTSHSFTLAGLEPSTTYHYRVKSKDNFNLETISSDNTFVTAAAGSSSSPSNTPGSSGNNSGSGSENQDQVPTSTTSGDGQTPISKISTNLNKPFRNAPRIFGVASDNTGVEKVEYSLDDGVNWLPVDAVSNVGARETSFNFQPVGLEDGNYLVRTRVTDISDLVGISNTITLIIDRLAPKVGGSLISTGSFVLKPSENGLITTLASTDLKFTLSAVGGPLTIDLLSGDKVFSLTKNTDNGLWSGTINFDKPGVYQLAARSVDGAQNLVSKRLTQVAVLPEGLVKTENDSGFEKAELKVYWFDNLANSYKLWDGAAYGQQNPQETKANGGYSLFLPEGKYYLEVSANGFKTIKTNFFELKNAQGINANFTLEKTLTINLGFFKLTPFGGTKEVEIETKLPEVEEVEKLSNRLLGKALPTLKLVGSDGESLSTSFFGKPTILSILNSWSPLTNGQLESLEQLASSEINQVVVFPQESVSRTEIFKKRGGYSAKILADPFGEVSDLLNLEFIPTHIFIDRRGIVREVVTGVLNNEQLLTNLKN